MKKTLLAAALAVGFAGVAQAETSVTLYGVVDAGIGYNRIKGADGFKASKTGLIDGVHNGSRWGLKGSEDIGNGLRAVFVLESGFDSRTGHSGQGTRLFGRQATIGLAADSWGQLDLGRQTNIASKYLPGIMDPFAASFTQANAGTAFTSQNTVRYDNMIMYQTPNFSGFQFGVGYSFETSGDQDWKLKGADDSNTRAITTGLRYANGPISVGLAYDQFKNKAAADNSRVSAWTLGGAYDFEVVKLHLGFGQTRNGVFQTQGIGDTPAGTPSGAFVASDGMKFNSYTVGVSAPVGGAGNVMASWHMADPRSNPDANPNWDMKKQQAYSLGYTYDLSKRTNLYAYGSYAKNVYFVDKLKSTAVGVGLRHRF